MDSIERKIYNKEYYNKNKIVIINKACAKVECTLCKRAVIKNNIFRHRLTDLCKRTQARNVALDKRLNDSIIN